MLYVSLHLNNITKGGGSLRPIGFFFFHLTSSNLRIIFQPQPRKVPLLHSSQDLQKKHVGLEVFTYHIIVLRGGSRIVVHLHTMHKHISSITAQFWVVKIECLSFLLLRSPLPL